MLERVWGKGNPPILLVGMYIGAATVENSMEVSQKTKIRTTVKVKVAQSCPTLCDPMEYTIHGIL